MAMFSPSAARRGLRPRDKDRRFSERYYGRFERVIPLPFEVEEDKAEATFKNGVLSVTLPKSPKAQEKA
jgi:HSP20 family protein